ncbi:phosphotransferase [Pseudoclavibacter sp. 13-3]|uniref:phosphotransferase n=1 Tax=Pseudoclavibacter sp. 13-3 TaxID=2901228 RepID=UPI001E41380B|nr:phosphotransferase [Pseudoclavibacter sp. 13-3]MCD7101310.1 phosphotransferase [Pseudoclavibacter sp. 13-3]
MSRVSTPAREADLTALLGESGFTEEPVNHLDEHQVRDLLREHYALDVDLRRLPTEKDDTFRAATDEASWTVKISAASEAPNLISLQTEAMIWAGAHMSAEGPPVPRVLRTTTGAATVSLTDDPSQSQRYPRVLRVLEFLPGVPIGSDDAPKLDGAAMERLGGACACLAESLNGFNHPADSRRLAWDLAELPTLAPLTQHLNGQDLDLTKQSLNEFAHYAWPAIADMRWQVEHNDFNPFNVLVGNGARIAGVIDFGDVVRTAAILNTSVAAGSMIDLDARGWWLVERFVSGYQSVCPISDTELQVLAVAAPARQAQRILLRGLASAQSPERAAYLASHATDLVTPLTRVLDMSVDDRVESLRALR